MSIPALPCLAGMGWQPSQFLSARAEAERAFQLAERLGSVNAAAAELGTTWPSLRRRSSATVWSCPPATRCGPAVDHRRGSPAQWAVGYPALDPVFVALTRRPFRGERPAAELHEWVRHEVDSASPDQLSIRLSVHTRGLTGWS
jgi:hypothetical protein